MTHNPINQCEIVKDLLPLYQDDICSDSSKKLIDEHLVTCEGCKDLLQKLKSTQLEEQLITEKNNILGLHAKKERKKTFTIGICTASVLMIPVIVCLICNLAIGHALDWFFIVLASLLLTASLTVVPLLAQEHTVLWTLGSFTISLLLLLFTICLYTHGRWFFLASVPTLFGLSVLFMPYVIRHIPLPKPLSQHKGLLVMIWDTIWLYAVLAVCGIYTATSLDYWRISFGIASYCLILPWMLFLIIRYGKGGAFTNAGLCVLFAGIFSSTINSVVALVLRESSRLFINADFAGWNHAAVDAITATLILLVTIPLGIAFLVIGYRKQRANKQ